MTTPKLFMLLLGCKPQGRHTEQHDIFFAIATELKELVPVIKQFWPEANGKIHLDAYRIVNHVDGYQVDVVEKAVQSVANQKLFFLNLGGYQSNVFEEIHYKMLMVAKDKATATANAKSSPFFKQYFSPHIDDKYGVDVDDVFDIEEVLPLAMKQQYAIQFTKAEDLPIDEVVLGYMPVDKL
ncbi:DUF1543 domain-containing protein [Pedobacter chitinilyticus]|uniref:DUF1543 domain-containing protein n=1 Tax=Pedobacter chitinilyticus TaxID=2233776 RepID=A0A3S4RQI7_9SPHI|nr:DUF1543 domain-containing protein [Pedobacter chitinilyticus]RWU07546.1 DUF1543 domain-containing protein [Pedobacter chitinilyticus]